MRAQAELERDIQHFKQAGAPSRMPRCHTTRHQLSSSACVAMAAPMLAASCGPCGASWKTQCIRHISARYAPEHGSNTRVEPWPRPFLPALCTTAVVGTGWQDSVWTTSPGKAPTLLPKPASSTRAYSRGLGRSVRTWCTGGRAISPPGPRRIPPVFFTAAEQHTEPASDRV